MTLTRDDRSALPSIDGDVLMEPGHHAAMQAWLPTKLESLIVAVMMIHHMLSNGCTP
jgi:hypothetical protein